jgi:hypothetical protein
MIPLAHRVLALALAAATTTTVPHREPLPGTESKPGSSWQIWLILAALSLLTGLALKLASDPNRDG